jgi:hypothetical protein
MFTQLSPSVYFIFHLFASQFIFLVHFSIEEYSFHINFSSLGITDFSFHIPATISPIFMKSKLENQMCGQTYEATPFGSAVAAVFPLNPFAMD